jgi:hypothetical protein
MGHDKLRFGVHSVRLCVRFFHPNRKRNGNQGGDHESPAGFPLVGGITGSNDDGGVGTDLATRCASRPGRGLGPRLLRDIASYLARCRAAACRPRTGEEPVAPQWRERCLLLLQFTVENDGVFTTPWSAAIVYQRPKSTLGEWPEFVCADNRHEYYSGNDTNVPRADKPDF